MISASHELVEHTGELELRLHAGSLPELFADEELLAQLRRARIDVLAARAPG